MTALRVIFGIPAVVGGVYMWITPNKKIRNSLATSFFVYSALYIAVFHFWLKAL